MGIPGSVYVLTYTLKEREFDARRVSILGIEIFSRFGVPLIKKFKEGFYTRRSRDNEYAYVNYCGDSEHSFALVKLNRPLGGESTIIQLIADANALEKHINDAEAREKLPKMLILAGMRI